MDHLATETGHDLQTSSTISRAANRRWSLAGLIFSAGAVLVLLVGRGSALIPTLSVTFAAIVLEALPFVALGALVGGLIEVFVSPDRISRLIPRRGWLAITAAGLLGLLIPVCECAVIPVTRRLIRKGVPFSAAVAYLIAGPIVNPIVAGSTVVAYGGNWWPMVVRLICGYGTAVSVALIIDSFYPGRRALRRDFIDRADADCHCGHGHDHPAPGASVRARILQAFHVGGQDFVVVTQFLVLGAFVAALSQTTIEREAFLALAETPAAAIGLMMALAVGLNLCSEADAFVAASFRATLPLAAQMAFMVLGPMLDLKLAAMYLSFVRKRAFIMMAVSMCILVFALMMIFHELLQQSAGGLR